MCEGDRGRQAFNSGGGGAGVDTALWLPPSQKGFIEAPPRNPTGADPLAPVVTRTRNSANSARRGGSEKASFAVYLVRKTLAILKTNS